MDMVITRRHYKNMIDFILVNRRWKKNSVTKCRTFGGPDVGSDHQLVMAWIRIKLKKIHVKTRQRRYNVELLKNAETKQDYCTMLQEKAANIDDSSTIMWSDIKEAYTSTAKKVLGYKQKQQRAPWITKEVLELSDERKRLKAVINRSVREVQTRLYHHT